MMGATQYPLQIPFEIIKGATPFLVRPMRSHIEKTILEFGVMTDNADLIFDNVCKLLGVPDELPYMLKVAWIYKVREVSFGSDLLLTYKCPSCGRVTESVILLEDLLSWPEIPKLRELGKFYELKDPDVPYTKIENAGLISSSKYLKVQDPKTLEEARDYAISLRSRLPVVKRVIHSKCQFCPNHKAIGITNKQFVLDSLSEHSMISMVQAYNAMAINGFTKLDVDSMLPFERELHLGLFRKKTEETLQSTQNMMK